MTHDPHHLTGAYAAGALDDAERAEVESHLTVCADCAREVADLRETLAELSVLTEAEPPPALRASILAAVAEVRPLPPVTPHVASTPAVATVTRLAPRRRPLTWLASAAAVLILVAGGFAWHPWSPDGPGTTTAQSVLDATDARTWSTPVGSGRATIARSTDLGRAALVLVGLATPPEHQAYQAWFQKSDGTMTSAGMVPAASSGTRLARPRRRLRPRHRRRPHPRTRGRVATADEQAALPRTSRLTFGREVATRRKGCGGS